MNAGKYSNTSDETHSFEVDKIKKIVKEYGERIKVLEAIVEKMGKETNPLDLNGDGKVDEKDASIAGKVMAKQRHK